MSIEYFPELVDVIEQEGFDTFTNTFLIAHEVSGVVLPDPEDFFCEVEDLDEKYRSALQIFKKQFFLDNLKHMDSESLADAIVREVKTKVVETILTLE